MASSLLNWTLDNIDPKSKNFTPPMDMRDGITAIKALPPLPGSAVRLIKLMSDPRADARKLAEIIELDPLLTAQIIRWASSSLYGYRGKITSVEEAVVRVLGFNFVLDLALGLAVLAPLKAPKEGAVGTKMFWIQALAGSHLMKKLAEQMPPPSRPPQQEIFLAALLHNIGFPLLGHQFGAEFSYLSTLIKANPGLLIFNLENFAFGVNHAEIGAWLMKAWGMPRPIVDVVYHHHNPCYRGENHQLALLTYLSDCLLGQAGIGDAANQTCPDELWVTLQLDEALCGQILDSERSALEKLVAADNLAG